MLKLSIPGFKDNITIEHLTLDFNGTLAVDGQLIPGVKEAIQALSKIVSIHVLTGDTFGTAREQLKDSPCKIFLLTADKQAEQKEKYILSLNPDTVIGIGNGHNDKLMMQACVISIMVIQKEGASAESLMAADIVCTDILSALDLLNHPLRLSATLRT